METEHITINDKIPLFKFPVPMFHADWHKAEELGLIYIYYDASGNDYWDHRMVFCKSEHRELILEWRNKILW